MGPSTTDTHGRQQRPRFYGKYPAVVVENEVKDGQPWGLLVVEHSTLLEDNPGGGGGKRKLRCKALPCQTPGAFILPDIGANVWLEYVQGDPRNAVWTGVFFNEATAPKNELGEKPTADQRLLASVSGHMIMLDDKAKNLILKDSGGNTVTLNEDRGIELKCGESTITLTDGKLFIQIGDQTFEMGSSGTKLNGSAIALQGLFDFVKDHTHLCADPGKASGSPGPPPLTPGKDKLSSP